MLCKATCALDEWNSAEKVLTCSGDGPKRCYDGAPMLLRGSTFCKIAGQRAGVIKSYSMWALARLLTNAGLLLHTYPQVPSLGKFRKPPNTLCHRKLHREGTTGCQHILQDSKYISVDPAAFINWCLTLYQCPRCGTGCLLCTGTGSIGQQKRETFLAPIMKQIKCLNAVIL